MMGGRTPETSWAVNKRQDNTLENFCIWLVIYLNCTMMHGLTNLKSISYLLQNFSFASDTQVWKQWQTFTLNSVKLYGSLAKAS
jgi:hypothetical protein